MLFWRSGKRREFLTFTSDVFFPSLTKRRIFVVKRKGSVRWLSSTEEGRRVALVVILSVVNCRQNTFTVSKNWQVRVHHRNLSKFTMVFRFTPCPQTRCVYLPQKNSTDICSSICSYTWPFMSFTTSVYLYVQIFSGPVSLETFFLYYKR